jgi:hypothetical protein
MKVHLDFDCPTPFCTEMGCGETCKPILIELFGGRNLEITWVCKAGHETTDKYELSPPTKAELQKMGRIK